MSSFQNTHWKDPSNIKNLLKFDFPPATFYRFTFFNLFHWNNENVSKVAGGKSNFNMFFILLRSLLGVFWKEDVQGYLNLDLSLPFIFGYVCGNALKISKNTILPSSQVQGLSWTSLTIVIIFSNVFYKCHSSKWPKTFENP